MCGVYGKLHWGREKCRRGEALAYFNPTMDNGNCSLQKVVMVRCQAPAEKGETKHLHGSPALQCQRHWRALADSNGALGHWGRPISGARLPIKAHFWPDAGGGPGSHFTYVGGVGTWERRCGRDGRVEALYRAAFVSSLSVISSSEIATETETEISVDV